MLEHGGNLAAAADRYGIALSDWIDLSTGINPDQYPIPAVADSVWRYLPPDGDGLTEAARSYYGCEQLLPTAGSQAALQVLPAMRAPGRIALPHLMYAEHAQAWRRHGHEIVLFEGIPDDALLAQCEVLVLCNPNNPTALLYRPEQLLAWHDRIAQRGGWIVVDEAFMDATPEFSLASYTNLPGLIVLRSLGKFFGLAGARVGFLLAAEPLLNEAKERLGPWPISSPARIIAETALQDHGWQQATRELLQKQSVRLSKLLAHYGLPPQSRTTLFQWVTTDRAEVWHAHLAKQGIWTRKFEAPQALRFGLPSDSAWARLEQALASFNG